MLKCVIKQAVFIFYVSVFQFHSRFLVCVFLRFTRIVVTARAGEKADEKSGTLRSGDVTYEVW